MYVLCVGLLFFSKRYVLDRSSEIVQSIIRGIRHGLADKVRLTELATFEKYGTSTIYARITQDTTTIANMSTIIINCCQQGVMVIFTLLYISLLSVQSFVLVAAGLAFGIFYYMGHSETFRLMWERTSQKETAFFDQLGHILQGFNEININRRKNEAVFKAYSEGNDTTTAIRVDISKHYNLTLIFSEVFFFLILGGLLFVLPKLHTEGSLVVTKVITSVLFLIGPMESIIYAMPGFANANNAARNIMELESQLGAELDKTREQAIDHYSAAAYQVIPFEKQLTLNGLVYQYPPKAAYDTVFQVGPIALRLGKGELIFVTGGNGSGKSTFLKLLTGLYKPSAGNIIVDGGDGVKGKVVSSQNYQQYQNLFSIIFSDYHLFDKVYGIERSIEPAEVKTLLKYMDLSEEKTSYEDGAFTNIRLSSGQKKRLALATALLEDKPIYVFDEVASDLDPEFRDKFYFEILQELKSRGKTVLVVSHDQQYWLVPDRLIQFQDGKARELSKAEVQLLSTTIRNV